MRMNGNSKLEFTSHPLHSSFGIELTLLGREGKEAKGIPKSDFLPAQHILLK